MHFFILCSLIWFFDHKKEKVYVVEGHLLCRDNAVVRQALGQVVTNLQTQAPNELTLKPCKPCNFQIISKKKFMDKGG